MSYVPPNSNGQATMANSTPVTLASDQSTLPANLVDAIVTGQTAQSTSGNNILLATAGSGSVDVMAANATYRSFYCQITGSAGIASGQVIFEGSNDNTTFVTLLWYDDAVVTGAVVNAATSIAANTNRFFSGKIPYRYFRCRISTVFSGGTVSAVVRYSQFDYVPKVTTVGQATAANMNVAIGSGTVTTVSTLSNTTQLTPGVAAANLGKAEDAVAASADTGVMALAVRSDTAATTVSANGDYHPLLVDAVGKLHTNTGQANVLDSGYSLYRNTALTNTYAFPKASAGNVYGFLFINTNIAGMAYVKLSNLASGGTVGTTAVVKIFPVPAAIDANTPGILYVPTAAIELYNASTGIGIFAVTGIADNNTTAPTTGIYVEVFYK